MLLVSVIMKRNQLLTALLTGGAAILLLASPMRTHGQSEVESAQLDLLIKEVSEQQALIAKNQAAIDEKLAVIGEELRVARIYVSRGGGRGN